MFSAELMESAASELEGTERARSRTLTYVDNGAMPFSESISTLSYPGM